MAYTDTERLDFILTNSALRVQGKNNSWHVLDMSNGLTFIVQNKPTARKAIDDAMDQMEQRTRLWQQLQAFIARNSDARPTFSMGYYKEEGEDGNVTNYHFFDEMVNTAWYCYKENYGTPTKD